MKDKKLFSPVELKQIQRQDKQMESEKVSEAFILETKIKWIKIF